MTRKMTAPDQSEGLVDGFTSSGKVKRDADIQ
jgi:hypothetical protein